MANSVHIMKMCSAFAENGHEVTLIYPDSLWNVEKNVHDIFEFYGVSCKFNLCKINPFFISEYFPAGSRIFMHAYLAAKKILYPLFASRQAVRIKPDIIVSRYLPAAFYASYFAELPIIYENHNFYSEMPRLSRRMFNKIIGMDSFRRLVVISNPLASDYEAVMGENGKGKIIVAPDGADPATDFSDIPTMGNHEVNIGYSGHLYAGRGMEIIAGLAEINKNYAFHVIGGTEKDIAFWKSRTADLENIYFYGFVPPKNVKSILNRMDILLAPYQTKVGTSAGIDTSNRMSPLKIFEYMALGKPIIVSDIPVIHEVLDADINAIYAKPDDLQAWQGAIKRLVGDKTFSSAIASNAKEKFLTRYTWAIRAKNILQGI